jgi:hypothetical protein
MSQSVILNGTTLSQRSWGFIMRLFVNTAAVQPEFYSLQHATHVALVSLQLSAFGLLKYSLVNGTFIISITSDAVLTVIQSSGIVFTQVCMAA